MAMSESPVGFATRKVFLLALLVAVFAAAVIDVVIPITILDIEETFSMLPGTVAQLDSIIALATVTTALLLAGFGDKFRYKSQVMIGLLLIAVCAIGLYLAPTFPFAQLVVPLNGIGSVLIVVSAQTFIGNFYPLDKKAKAIGWIAAAGTIANALGSPIIGFMTGIGGWRSVFTWFMLPTAVVSLLFVFLVFPHNLVKPQANTKKESFKSGFKQILTNKSAVACLVTAFFITAYSFGALVFEVTYLRQIFSASPGFAALVGPMAGAAIITIGAIIGGHVVDRVGRKRLTVFAILLAGSLLALSYFIQDLILFIFLHCSASFFIGITITASSNLMLEQIPHFRGTAMSLNSAFSSVGTAFGVALTGVVLNSFINPTIGFQALGLTVGVLAFSGALVNLFFAREPLKRRV